MLSDRVNHLGTSSTLRISAKAEQLRRDGVDVVNLSVGEPDFPTPLNIRNAAKLAMDKGKTKYTANNGIIELRETIANDHNKSYGANYIPSQVIVSTGAKQCLYNACLTLLNKGDEVIVPAPYWVSYPDMVSLADATSIFVPTKEENGFRLTVDELTRNISGRTRAIILNNPSNPTGSAYSADQLRKLLDVCVAENIFVIADEIYAKLVYDGFSLTSVASFGEAVRKQSLIINGFSKAYSMTGWRLGYALGPKDVIDGMAKVQSHATSNPNSIAQWAAVEALTGPQDEISHMCQEFERRRNAVMYKLEGIPHCSCYKPQGAFYLFPNMSYYHDLQLDGIPIRNSAGLAYYLLKHAHVALVPGDAFGADNYIRISYATSMENLEKGVQRIGEALGRLAPTASTKLKRLNNTITREKAYSTIDAPIDDKLNISLQQEVHDSLNYDEYHEWIANIGGVLLKLVTNSPHLIDFWMDNWYPAALESDTEPHGFIYAIKGIAGRSVNAYYHPISNTSYSFNSAFYPQLRALTLGLLDEIQKKTHNSLFVAGHVLDVGGRAVLMLAPPGSKGNLLVAELMKLPDVKLIGYDGVVLRLSDRYTVAESIERKNLLPTRLAMYAPELGRLFERSKLENVVTQKGECTADGCGSSNNCPLDHGEMHCFQASGISRALLDPYWLGGTAKHLKHSQVKSVVLVTNNGSSEQNGVVGSTTAMKLISDGAFNDRNQLYRQVPYFNPYMIIHSEDNMSILASKWSRLINQAPLYRFDRSTGDSGKLAEEILGTLK